jgi:Protein of unknown function (DUF1524)
VEVSVVRSVPSVRSVRIPRRGLFSRRRVLGIVAAVPAMIVLSLVAATPASATPPNIPSKSTAQAELNALTVAAEGSMTGYSRDLFPHWITISGTCNTRETVLKRDGTNVVVDGSCYPTSGRWYSPYDGITEYAASDIDIDHVVPLAEAWRSGARYWTTSTRQSFANDLNYPQLIAVTDNVNVAKSDQDPSTWKPPVLPTTAPTPKCGSARSITGA